MIYLRLFTDALGETHFEDIEERLTLVPYAPPAPPLFISDFHTAAQYGFLRIPAGWYGDWHPVPGRQLQIMIEGVIHAQASDGEVRVISPGTVVLLEDTKGKGHKSWVPGEKDMLIAVVKLA